MSINLLKMLQDQMGSTVVEQASKFLGESGANTTSGINALLPSLLGGLIGKGSTESGASGILDMITKGNTMEVLWTLLEVSLVVDLLQVI